MCPTKVNGIKTFISKTIVVVQSLRKVHDDRLVISTNNIYAGTDESPFYRKTVHHHFRHQTSSPPHTHTYEVHPQQAQVKNVQRQKIKLKTMSYVKVKELIKNVKNKFKYQVNKT